ncbi:MAG: dihydrofolate reductase, partial [Blautia sp.]|nr:dihydrofolate reductase [Blautia sp.]
LKNRTNIVLTKNRHYDGKGAILVHSMEELLEEIKKYPSDEVYCIGGDSIYKQLLPYCDMAHVTKIDFAYAADSYFPNLDELPEWHVAAESEEQTYFDLEYKFVRYERTKK